MERCPQHRGDDHSPDLTRGGSCNRATFDGNRRAAFFGSTVRMGRGHTNVHWIILDPNIQLLLKKGGGQGRRKTKWVGCKRAAFNEIRRPTLFSKILTTERLSSKIHGAPFITITEYFQHTTIVRAYNLTGREAADDRVSTAVEELLDSAVSCCCGTGSERDRSGTQYD
ncbi:hypothetical protein BDV96DRAFT_42212 [Lophiotrema nucula]|uniref:Uncharacterized protein n=1 Tax=Lophiotrema nucula TaxID=690887 RepID=A0A6A5Z9H0_9PLEO|nr:hypothetical protein BDV96DRAFT_42212 [Lophiotrema nucula]